MNYIWVSNQEYKMSL